MVLFNKRLFLYVISGDVCVYVRSSWAWSRLVLHVRVKLASFLFPDLIPAHSPSHSPSVQTLKRDVNKHRGRESTPQAVLCPLNIAAYLHLAQTRHASRQSQLNKWNYSWAAIKNETLLSLDCMCAGLFRNLP